MICIDSNQCIPTVRDDGDKDIGTFLVWRQNLYHKNVELELDHKTLDDIKVRAMDTIHVADRGIVLPKRVANVLAYAGPIAMFQLYLWNHKRIVEFIYNNILNNPDYLKD